MIKKSISILLQLVLYLFLTSGPAPLFSQNRDINHLNIEDFNSFFAKTDTWDSWYDDLECSLWHSPFICWNQRTKMIMVPDIRELPTSKKRLPDTLADELRQWSEEKNPLRETYLVTDDDMIYISLKYLMGNKYQFVNWIKENCNHPESKIKFYIFHFIKDKNKKDKNKKYKRMDIYYCLVDNAGNYQFVTNVKSVGDSDCIGEWKSLLKVDFPDVRITMKISGLIGTKPIIEISSPITNIAFFNIRKPSSTINYKGISRIIPGEIPNIEIEFNLSSGRDIEIIKTNGIWIGKIEKNARFTYSSFYSLIFDYYEKTRSRFEDYTFEMFCSRTTDFKIGESDFSPDIENKELPLVLTFIKDTIKKRKKNVFVQLIGYADIKGKDGIEWKKKNFELAILRAEKVKKWFEDNLKDLGSRVEFEAQGCGEEYYNHKDRSVEIRIF